MKNLEDDSLFMKESDLVYISKLIIFFLIIVFIVCLTLEIQKYMSNKTEEIVLINKSVIDENGNKIDSIGIPNFSFELIKLKSANLTGYEFIKIEDTTKNRSY